MNTQDLKNKIREMTFKREDTSLLKYVLAESERYNKEPIAVIEKLIADNKNTYELSKDEKYLVENEVLSKFLPEYISQAEILENIKGIVPDNSGKSFGSAIKYLKTLGLVFKNEDVKVVLSQMFQTV